MLDKNSKEINVGDYICIKDFKSALLVENKVSIGIQIREKNKLPLESLVESYQRESNLQGFIPIAFIKKNKIKLCPMDKFPECHL